MMTTTVTTQLHSSPSRHIRRSVAAVLAGAAIVASSVLVVSRINDDNSPRVASQGTNESTLGVTQMNAAFWAYTPESTFDLTLMNGAFHAATQPDVNPAVVVTSHPHLVTNGASLEACASGYPDACPFAHTWVAATPLQGLGDIVAGSSFVTPVAATPLQGLGDIVAGLVGQR
jgi:hypothetical protein